MAETPWLDEARALVGIKEIRGSRHNPMIVALFNEVGHEEITDDETAWCAAFMGACLKRSGHPTTPREVNLLARSYLTYGVATQPRVGAIAIWPRGNSKWQGHVNCVDEVREYKGRLQVKCIGGNQSNAVTVTSWTDAEKALGFRWPVKPTVKDLRDAGSSEINGADNLEVGSAVTVGVGVSGAIAKEAISADVPPFTTDVIVHKVGIWQQLMDGANGLAKLVISSPWLVVVVVVAVGGVGVARWWKRNRVRRHRLGFPISNEAQTNMAGG